MTTCVERLLAQLDALELSDSAEPGRRPVTSILDLPATGAGTCGNCGCIWMRRRRKSSGVIGASGARRLANLQFSRSAVHKARCIPYFEGTSPTAHFSIATANPEITRSCYKTSMGCRKTIPYGLKPAVYRGQLRCNEKSPDIDICPFCPILAAEPKTSSWSSDRRKATKERILAGDDLVCLRQKTSDDAEACWLIRGNWT